MRRRIHTFLCFRPYGLLSTPTITTAHRKASAGQSSGGRMEDEDPAAVLRQLQEDMHRRAASDGKDLPPAPPRRSGKTLFFDEKPQPKGEEGKSSGDSQSSAVEQGEWPTASAAKPRSKSEKAPPNPFLQKLSKMEADTQSTSFPTYDAAAEGRRKRIDAKIKEERSKMLIFRDVGMDLDKPILSRDVFLVVKYFRYGMEFAVDNELERMLRYFNEHAMNELKIIQDSKLMRGPPTLSRKRRHAPRPKAAASSVGKAAAKNDQQELDGSTTVQHQSLQFQVSSLFPQVRCANARQFCAPTAVKPAAATTLTSLIAASQNASSFSTFFPSAAAAEVEGTKPSAQKTYNAKDDSLFTVMSPSMFRRPAVVIFSQLGQKFGSQADTEWRRLAYASICPGLLPYVPMPAEKAKGVKHEAADVQSPFGAPSQSRSGKDGVVSRTAASRAMPIDVISLRSADVYKYSWVQRLYIRRFANSLSQAALVESAASEGPSVTEVNNALIASTTFVGSQLLEPFYTTLGLRNYLLPHVMLVDHEGVIRWLSGGCPDANEKAVFASLLKQLEAEYYKASK